MGNYRKYWFTLIGVMIVCFSLLGYYGVEVYRTAPPIPQQVQTEDGRVLYTQEGILDGQTAWQSVGGMQLGSIWGHGAYQAPDWTADWLHRELSAWLDLAAHERHGKAFDQLGVGEQGALRAELKQRAAQFCAQFELNPEREPEPARLAPLLTQAQAAWRGEVFLAGRDLDALRERDKAKRWIKRMRAEARPEGW